MMDALHAFSVFGVELEYMIVDRESLSILPVADELLHRLSGTQASEIRHGTLAWSNELALHLLELKNVTPTREVESLPAAFQNEIQQINHLLESMNGMLMPTGMHPWMNPAAETRLWPHKDADIYLAYDRIFNCKQHGWANLQSMHLNLPFADDYEFERLHAAVRLLLPILPALAASSPISEGNNTGFMNFRMENYRTHQIRVPSTIGRVIPETVTSRAGYEAEILSPMYRDIAVLDEKGILQHEWLNVRGAVPRFDRNAIEIRVIDTQECPQANLAIAAVTIDAVRALYDETYAPLAEQQAMSTDELATIMHACICDAEQAIIENAEYLRLLGLPAGRCEGRDLWRHLIGAAMRSQPEQRGMRQNELRIILEHGPLARRILRALGSDFSRGQLRSVYRELCDCLEEGRMFQG
ncbi:Gamma-glutamyl:cysteine ligase YbdK, ATP-grasp superfamily [Nitrosospira briensis]|uniref:Gamma-glutamyl:cysteine ligase YbdK, ATP-grasp superfamily n=1 Tax=Nitrosospira briensis TaxID=35799 RepID=A0A1I4XEA7_9PROT|nr:glutamate-cysteine ligase family protein [Nitrosospira briensis]SFN24238.1 Gamma-glutamyl:cysteine ligase YbdK, ATP-grasp superfamily [Nitrosospira briensis]